MGGNEGAFTLTPDQMFLRRQLINGFTNRPLAYLKTGGQFDFAGDSVARPPLTGLQATHHQIFDLPIERAKCG